MASTTIVTDPLALRKFATASEAQLSARAAVSDFGFSSTLGDLNVYLGTSVHKLVLKNKLYPELQQVDAQQQLHSVLRSAVARRVMVVADGSSTTVDIIPCVRRIFLDVTIDFLIGRGLLADHEQFVEEYIMFQDALEEATAKAVVLPSAVAQFVLRPVGRRRATLVATLAQGVERAWREVDGISAGMWTTFMKGLRKDQLVANDFVDFPSTAITPVEAAEFMIGLLFAAHKVGSRDCETFFGVMSFSYCLCLIFLEIMSMAVGNYRTRALLLRKPSCSSWKILMCIKGCAEKSASLVTAPQACLPEISWVNAV